ncbi:MAG: hypoxanthine phosphoribosyltransferase [Anaerolineales bacterium]|nr:hypoxanthine phosphoribosyltransferase [Chloroflexota bacterium]MBL6979982.1 hypoxanthine phosphoribosyltransferase [Anaerolineales bacterium]
MSELHPDLARVILSEEEIQERVKELAAQISADYADAERIYLIGILKGAFIFLADLCRHLTIPHIVDFMSVSSYGRSGAVSGAVRLMLDLREPIRDEHVIIVEDIVDTGHTLDYINHTLQGREPTSMRTCALLEKKRESLEVPVDYLGFTIPDFWVVGYGLDYADTHRTLPFVAELKPEAYQ